jgi:phasin family protein
MEIVQQAMSEMTDVMKALSGRESPQEKTAKQAEILKQAYQHAVSNLQELADLIQRANADAMKLVNARFADAMDEVKQMAAKTGS